MFEFLAGALLLGSSACLGAAWNISLFMQDFTPPRTTVQKNTQSKLLS